MLAEDCDDAKAEGEALAAPHPAEGFFLSPDFSSDGYVVGILKSDLGDGSYHSNLGTSSTLGWTSGATMQAVFTVSYDGLNWSSPSFVDVTMQYS